MASSEAYRSRELSPADVERIRGLLRSKTKEAAARALFLLESLNAVEADFEAVFTEPVIKAVLQTWDAETWAAVSRAIVPHDALFATFRAWAEKAYSWHLEKGRDESFNGLTLALVPAARLRFLATWGAGAKPTKPFIDLVALPAGSFQMGIPLNDADGNDGMSQVAVRITTPFAFSRTVVTQGQWRAVMGTEPWRYHKLDDSQCGDDFPAVFVTWDDAVLFCTTLTELERETGRLTAARAYRLPTEAEWEYACRAGTTTAYSFGDNPEDLGDYGWYDGNSRMELHEVACKDPNPWGLFDMHGNVGEWCADWHADHLAGGADPRGPASGSHRVRRGGCWGYGAPSCRSAYRLFRDPLWGYCRSGFRVVCAG